MQGSSDRARAALPHAGIAVLRTKANGHSRLMAVTEEAWRNGDGGHDMLMIELGRTLEHSLDRLLEAPILLAVL